MSARIRQHSAGGVVVRNNGGLEVLLIKPQNRNRWQLPKGAIDPGENAETAAIREVREEGGVDALVVQELPPETIFYQMHGQPYMKTVDFFLMKYKCGSIEDHDEEVDEARWFAAASALETLTFETERRVVAEGLRRLEQESTLDS